MHIRFIKRKFGATLNYGYLNITTEGEYISYCGSDDGGHGYNEKEGKIYLEKGAHRIEVLYFQVGS